jgi:peptidoglycan/xylan/chitin deacetylase (PgdA/CDA1 family)
MLAISLIVVGCWRVSRVACWIMGRPRPQRQMVVLTYHGVSASDAAAFEWQMRHIQQRAIPVFADAPPTDGEKPVVAVTFDDAFQSVIDRALPVLEQCGIPATIFVPTGHMGQLAGWVHPESAKQRLGPVASREALQALKRRRVKIGSHSVTHPRLAALDDVRLHSELATSRSMLERITDSRVGMLALPYGSCSNRVITAAEHAGYDRVFANVPLARGTAAPLVGRIDVSPRDWRLEFHLKMQGAYGWMAVAVPAKREMLRTFGRPQEA